MVRRGRVRRHGDRRAGAGGDHVDRGREPLDPEHLQGVRQPWCQRRAGGPAEQVGVAGGEVRRAGVRVVLLQAVRDQPAAAGGVWILQTLPAIVVGLYTRWFHRWALLIGWAVGMGYGTWLAYGVRCRATRTPTSAARWCCSRGAETTKVYIALLAVIANLVVTVVLTSSSAPCTSTRASTRPRTTTTGPTRRRGVEPSSTRTPSRTASFVG